MKATLFVYEFILKIDKNVSRATQNLYFKLVTSFKCVNFIVIDIINEKLQYFRDNAKYKSM